LLKLHACYALQVWLLFEALVYSQGFGLAKPGSLPDTGSVLLHSEVGS
jgi:hypothetical protein